MQEPGLLAQFSYHAAWGLGQIRGVAVQRALCKLNRVADSPWEHDPKLRQLCAQRVDCLRALSNNQIPCPVKRNDRLLVWCLDLKESHR